MLTVSGFMFNIVCNISLKIPVNTALMRKMVSQSYFYINSYDLSKLNESNRSNSSGGLAYL